MSASISGNLEPQFNPFEETSLAEIIQITAIAWSRMKQPDPHDLEDGITFRLAGRIANDPQFAESPYDVVAQYWELGLGGELLGRIDLRFKHRHSKRLYFAFEAKRLHVTYPKGRFSTEYATYTGPDGMGAFVDETYAKGFAAGGMLGYVMDGQSKSALDGLALSIDKRKTELKLSPDSCFAKSDLSHVLQGCIDGTFLSETPRTSGPCLAPLASSCTSKPPHERSFGYVPTHLSGKASVAFGGSLKASYWSGAGVSDPVYRTSHRFASIREMLSEILFLISRPITFC